MMKGIGFSRLRRGLQTYRPLGTFRILIFSAHRRLLEELYVSAEDH